uniref:DENN domain containing 2A n=1 Tax=Loxodonta africana TaxID=9785 RepID=G3TBX4_LOXAF
PRSLLPDMLSPAVVLNGPAPELQAGDSSRAGERQLHSILNPCPTTRGWVRHRIKDKISEWEGKKEPLVPAPGKKADGQEADVASCVPERRGSDAARTGVPEAETGSQPEAESTEEAGSEGPVRARGQEAAWRPEVAWQGGEPGTLHPVKDSLSVLRQVRRLEQALKDGSARLAPQLPGTCYSLQCPLDKAGEGPSLREGRVGGSESSRRLLDLGTQEPTPEPAGERKGSSASPWDQSLESVYSEYEESPLRPFISPPPKPRRTFQHEEEGARAGQPGRVIWREKKGLPTVSMTPAPHPDQPSPLPNQCLNTGCWPKSQEPELAQPRKSYEFEDLVQSSESSTVDWYAQSKLELTRTLSEENVYEDILDQPMKESLYEAVELHGHCLEKKCVSNFPGSPASSIPNTPLKQSSSKPVFFRHNSEKRNFKLLDARKPNRDRTGSPSRVSPPSTPSSPDDTSFNLGDPQNGGKKRKIPKLVLRINAIYEARRGKKRVKRLSQSAESSSGKVTDENSESDSDTEEKLEAHSQRLVHVQARLKQAPRCPPPDRDLVEHPERRLFEYFVVVSLHKKQTGTTYVPELTQQFPPKLEKSFKFMREAEDQLKAIPQFCFPDAKDWAPVQQFTSPSETFSFVLTGEDGSRRFGYCRRLLPGGKGKRLPEVYCIVSRLGCFSLFSKILDEVEKRRGISPALVQPFMRSVMEAPFPALGKTIVVKNFLPGSGTEVIKLCRPLDSRLEHVDFESLFSSLSVRHLVRVFASLLLERRVIFIADKLSTLSTCCHSVVALTYPFTWQHTYVPVLPPSMIDIVCSPTPFLIGLLTSTLPLLQELPLEEVLVVDLDNNRFLRQMDDEDSILPRKLQAALEHVLEQRNELASEHEEGPPDSRPGECGPPEAPAHCPLRSGASLAAPGHTCPLTSSAGRSKARDRSQSRSSSPRRTLPACLLRQQTFRSFAQERALRRQDAKGLFEVRAQEYLETLPSSEHGGVNRFLKGLGNKMKFLHKK